MPLVVSAAQTWNINPGLALQLGVGNNLTNIPVVVGANLVVTGLVQFVNASELQVGNSTITLSSPATMLDFSESINSSCYFAVGYSGAATVNQSAGTVNLYSHSTSTGALLLGGQGSTVGGAGTYNLNGGTLQDTNTKTADYVSVGDGTGNVAL